jgi:glycosyltransferase involved in cell wall biosynthesis
MSIEQPKVSIIIPMYNVEKYVRRCLDSVLNQTFTDWQAICVDDGCSDKTGEIAAEYAACDKRFIVLHGEHGGPSGARNMALKHATGEYIMCLDGDDFIHPQTMEITLGLALRDKADMVAYTYDRAYRPYLMIRHLLKKDIDSVEPFAIKRKYNLSKIKTLTTDNVFEYATESTHNAFNKNRRWLIKHCQVWKNLYRRDLIKDIKFIDGILFEDFPWWSEVLLKNPRTVIANLPLYFYRPNFKGIVLSAKQIQIMQSLFIGLGDIYEKYKKNANDYQMKMWTENFLWFFIARAFDKTKYLKTDKEFKLARDGFKELNETGMFDNVPNEWYALREKIYRFIDK